VASTYFYCRFPQPTLGGSGDIIVAGFVQDNDLSQDWTICDGASNTCASSTNTYTNVTLADTTNNELSVLAYSLNDTSVTTIIFACGGTCAALRGPWVGEWTGIGGFDKASPGVFASSTTVTAGSTTPAVTGELIIQQALNEWIGGYTANSGVFTAGSQSNITWQLGIHDDYVPVAVQYGVYGSTAAINPTMTESVTGFVSQALFFKPGTGPAPPSTIYITSLKHIWYQVSGTNTVHFACPAADNLAYFQFTSSASDDVTSATINGASMTQTAAKLTNGTVNILHNYYIQNATLSPAQTLVASGTITGGLAAGWAYCVANANTTSFKQATQNTGNQSAAAATLQAAAATITITPNAAGNLLFGEVAIANNTTTGLTVAGQQFVTSLWSNSVGNSGQMDQGNGSGSMIAPNTSSQGFTWNLFFTSTNAVGNWASEADEFH
jgi:hypothetical protein